MATTSLARDLGSIFHGGSAAGLSDRQLVERFATCRDEAGEAAFAVLVARHGPMVGRICRQLLGDHQHAEDAFQAVFLVLARKAGSLREPDLLAKWLYGVAVRTSRCARLRLNRRRRAEEAGSARQAATADRILLDTERAEALHRAIDRLPGSFRPAVMLCYFEGLTLEEAAHRLRWPVGTLRSRLARAREKLRRGLTRRGFALSGAALTAMLAPGSAAASVSPLLCDSTTGAAMHFAARHAARGALAAPAAALAQEVLRAMLVHKLKTAALSLLLLAVAGGGGWLSRPLGIGDEPTTAARQAAAEPGRRVPERFLVRYNGCAMLGPDGEEKERLETITNGAGAISPDGHWAAFSQSEANPPPGEREGKLVVQSRINPEERRIVPLIWGTTGSSFLPLWSSDSKRILICEQGQNDDGTRGSACRVYDLGSNGLTKLHLPDAWWPSDWSADGKRVLTSLRAGNGSMRVAWVHVDGSGEPEFVTSDQEVAYGARLSPDNRKILCMVRPRNLEDEGRRARLYAIDLATKKRTMIDKPGHTHGYCWSSDGSRVAYTWQLPIRKPEDAVERKTYLITCDPDGTNQKTVAMRKYEVPKNSSGATE